MIKIWKTLADDNRKLGKGFDLMLKEMLIVVATAICQFDSYTKLLGGFSIRQM